MGWPRCTSQVAIESSNKLGKQNTVKDRHVQQKKEDTRAALFIINFARKWLGCRMQGESRSRSRPDRLTSVPLQPQHCMLDLTTVL